MGDADVPDHLVCPITNELFGDPVLCTGDGHTYERTAIEEWLARGNKKSPLTGVVMASPQLVPNFHARSQADEVRGHAVSDRPQVMGVAPVQPGYIPPVGCDIGPPVGCNDGACSAPAPSAPPLGSDYGTRPVAREQPRLRLVKKGSPEALKLSSDTASALRAGGPAPLVTDAGDAVGPFWTAPRTYGPWRYIDLGVGQNVRPMSVRLDGVYIVWDSHHGEMVFDVSLWKLKENRHLVAVQAKPGNPGGPTRMSKGVCGRDFILHEDGTVSPRTAPHLRLGFSSSAAWEGGGRRVDGHELAGDWCCTNPLGCGCQRIKPIDSDTIESFGSCMYLGPGVVCCGGQVRTRIAGTNNWVRQGDANDVTSYNSPDCGCTPDCGCWSCLCKVPWSRWTPPTALLRDDRLAEAVPAKYRWQKVTAYDIAKGRRGDGADEHARSTWFCCCWLLGIGMSRFTKAASRSEEDTLTQRGWCWYGLCCPFEQKRHRLYVNGAPTNGFYKEGDEGNIDWYLNPGCVGNGEFCSCRC
eukprot:TRINITY_DN529_c0_g1_i2.p1 TRINITY_DN529_c0_g1~~TRINITY_DN529_c0_g1_i2.p1  ORF type:complete len:524 (+),score=78.93 TRINITY_DN529_c0_g1_i2:69-1640(+)